jgi:hypothetical protein
MATRTSIKRRKNPAAIEAGDKTTFPFLDADYPVKPWINPVSGQRFQTIAVRLDDGTFLATVAEDPEVRATASTQAAAERAVLAIYRTQRNPDEDEVLVRVAEASKGKPRMEAGDVLKELGYGLDGHRRKK